MSGNGPKSKQRSIYLKKYGKKGENWKAVFEPWGFPLCPIWRLYPSLLQPRTWLHYPQLPARGLSSRKDKRSAFLILPQLPVAEGSPEQICSRNGGSILAPSPHSWYWGFTLGLAQWEYWGLTHPFSVLQGDDAEMQSEHHRLLPSPLPSTQLLEQGYHSL